MPNICWADIIVKGRKDAVDEFKRILSANYDYYNMNFSHIPHLYRIFDVQDIFYNQQGLFVTASYRINCAWSVYCCMMKGPHTYYNTNVCEDSKTAFTRTNDIYKAKFNLQEYKPSVHYGSNIIDLSKILGLYIEIISEEDGMGFMEHYIVDHGLVVLDQCVDCVSYYIDDYNTLEDFLIDNPESDIDLTPEQFKELRDADEIEYIKGGIPWDFNCSDSMCNMATVEMCRIIK